MDTTDSRITFAIPSGYTTLNPIRSGTEPTPTAPAITTETPLPAATVGTAYSVQLAADGTAPITFSATGLPAWLTLSETGLLSGTPDAAGSSTFTVTAVNAAGSAQKEFTLTVQQGSGGGGSSSGSSDNTSDRETAPAIEVITRDGRSIAVIAPRPTVSGGSTNVTLTTRTLQSGIAAAERAAEETGTQGVVEIRVESEEITDIKATLPASGLEDIAGSGADTLRLTGPIGTVELDGAALSAIAEQARGSQVSLEIDAVAPERLDTAQRELVGDRPVYDFSVTSLGLEIHSFSGGTATVTLPYTLKDGEDPQDIVIYYLCERGGPDAPRKTVLERMHTVYDPESGTVRFLTGHLSLYTVGSWSNPFADVADGAWYYEDVAFVSANSLMEGAAADAFSPDAPVTRATAATLLYRLAGSPGADGGPAFVDVSDGAWYADAVRWAAANGIAQGVGEDRFDPDAPVTRQDLAVFLTRYLDYEGTYFALTQEYVTFADQGDIAGYADESLQTLYKLGVIQGVGGDRIDPLGQSTRAQAAAMLHRLLTVSQKAAE